MSDIYRKWTIRLSSHALHRLCLMLDPVYYIHRELRCLPGVGKCLSRELFHLLPMSLQPDRESRMLDTFDWYSPKFQSKHTYEEVFRWFEDCGLVDLRVLSESIAVQGRKPVEKNGPMLSIGSPGELTDFGDRRALAAASGGTNRMAL
jgi:hypothetical protein